MYVPIIYINELMQNAYVRRFNYVFHFKLID